MPFAVGDLLARLRLTEAQVVQQEQQLAAVVGQQEAFKEVITRLVESLENQKLSGSRAAVAEVQELQKQVRLEVQDNCSVNSSCRAVVLSRQSMMTECLLPGITAAPLTLSSTTFHSSLCWLECEGG